MHGTTTALIGGKDRVLKFNINADIAYERLHGLNGKNDKQRLEIASGISMIEWIRDAIYCALMSADLEKGNVIDYTQYTVGEWITAMPQAELESILLANSESKPQTGSKKKVRQ